MKTQWQSKPHAFFWWLCTVCLSVYLAYAAYLSRSGLFRSAAQTIAALLWFAVIAALMAVALTRLSRLPVKRAANAAREPLRLAAFAAGAGVTLVMLAVKLLANYPGGVTVDSAVQWTQAVLGEYCNWHPVFHTLLIRLAALVKQSYSFVLAVQAAAFAAAMGYLVATLHAWGVKLLPLVITAWLISASPIVGNTMMYLWKDNAMTIGATVLFAQCVNAYFSRGEWLAKPQNAVAFGLALAFATMVRHNAIVLTLPMAVIAALVYRRQLRGTLIACATALACMALVWGPLYSALGVTYVSNTAEEAVGVPMTIICNVRKLQPEALDAETRAFTDRMGDEAAWDGYRLDNYNSIKFGQTRRAITQVTTVDVLRMTASTFASAPRVSFEALNGVTDLVWGLADEGAANVNVRNSGDLPDVIAQNGRSNRLGSALEAVLTAPDALLPLQWYFGNLGVPLALMLVLAVGAIRREGCAALLLCLPTLLYNLATMCVLCGVDARFFSYGTVLCTMALFVLPRRVAPILPKEAEAA